MTTPTPREALAELVACVDSRRHIEKSATSSHERAIDLHRNTGRFDRAWEAARAALAVPAQPSDTQRLDWLDKQRDLIFDCYMQDGKITHILRQHWGVPLGHGPTPRAAIDAAMKLA